MEGLYPQRYYTTCCVGHRTGDSRGIGVGLIILHRVRAKHAPDLFYSALGLSLTRTGRSAAGFFFAFWRFGTILNGFFFQGFFLCFTT